MAWNGLLGMGGFGVGGQDMPTNSLLGNFYDPAEMRKYQMKQMLLGLGAGLMAEKGMGKGLALGLAAGDRAGTVYRDNAMDAYKIKTAQDEQAYNREWNQKKWDYELGQDKQANARANTELQLKLDAAAAPDTTAPTVQTFYENGVEVKKQWVPEKNDWVTVGGPKAPSNGITITNPDGTTTQIGGTGSGKMSEGDKRNKLLGNQVATQEPIILETFDALSDPQNLAGTNVPGGRYIMTGNGKAAYDAISNILGNWLYMVSGATATDDEVRKRTNEILPSFGDDPRTISLKKARLQSYIDGMKQAAGINSTGAPAAQPTVDVDSLVKQYGGGN